MKSEYLDEYYNLKKNKPKIQFNQGFLKIKNYNNIIKGNLLCICMCDLVNSCSAAEI